MQSLTLLCPFVYVFVPPPLTKPLRTMSPRSSFSKRERTAMAALAFISHVIGLVNFSLALCTASYLLEFRKALAEVVVEKLVVLVGHPTPSMQRHQEAMLQTLCSTGTRVAERQQLLRSTCNGDWTNQQRVEVYIEAGVTYDRKDVQERVVAGLLRALCGKVFSTFPRHRWLGCDISVDQIGCLDMVHGLGTAAFQRFLIKQSHMEGGQATTGISKAENEPEPSSAFPEQIAEQPAPFVPDSVARGSAEALPPPPAADPNLSGLVEESSWPAWAAQNAHKRQVAGQWLSRSPLLECISCDGASTPSVDSWSSLLRIRRRLASPSACCGSQATQTAQ